MTDSLYRICMKNSSVFVNDLRQFSDRFYSSDLVIREHYRNKSGVGAHL